MCERLTFQDDGLYHKRSIRNTMSVKVDHPVILVGIGVYGGTDDDLFDETLNVTFDRSTTSVKVYDQNDLLGEENVIVSNSEAKALAKDPRRRLKNAFDVDFRHPVPLIPGVNYDLEHSLIPTDVTNHYSGWPITRLGAELWTCYGRKAHEGSHCEASKVNFEFGESSR